MNMMCCTHGVARSGRSPLPLSRAAPSSMLLYESMCGIEPRSRPRQGRATSEATRMCENDPYNNPIDLPIAVSAEHNPSASEMAS